MKVITIALNNANVFLLKKKKDCLLVDTGLEGDGPEILEAIKKRGFALKAIIITHAHYDHAGALSEIHRRTRVPVICHAFELPYLRAGKTSVLKPQGTTMANLVKTIGLSDKDTQRFGATDAEYIAFDESLDLKTVGFDGYVKALPGHTPGSSCVFTPVDILCGDTVFNVSARHFPPIFSDQTALMETFRRMKASGCRYIYPAHGKRMRVKDLRMDWPIK